jgi:hypothetical protein
MDALERSGTPMSNGKIGETKDRSAGCARVKFSRRAREFHALPQPWSGENPIKAHPFKLARFMLN